MAAALQDALLCCLSGCARTWFARLAHATARQLAMLVASLAHVSGRRPAMALTSAS